VFYDPTLQIVPYLDRPLKWYFVVGAIALGLIFICLISCCWYFAYRYYKNGSTTAPFGEDNNKPVDSSSSNSNIYDTNNNNSISDKSIELKLTPKHSKGFTDFNDENTQ